MQAPFYFAEMKGMPDSALAYSYADVLFRCGFESEDSLRIRVFYWHGLFDDIRPDLLVCDHSPTAVLAAAGRVPTVHVGSGFANPPIGKPLIALNPGNKTEARERENMVMDAIRAVQDSFGVRPPETVSSLFESAEIFACCLPELDPYRSVRDPPAVGPLHALPGFAPVRGKPFLFGYLNSGDPRALPLAKGLAKAKVQSGLYVRGAPGELAETLRGSSVTLFERPQNLPEALKSASAVLHHGGLSTTETALAAGRPQFLLPRNLEQDLTAKAVEAMGCGVNLNNHGADYAKLIRRLQRDNPFAARSKIMAEKVAGRGGNPTETVVSACLRHLS
jgi:hypothetical protein